MVYTFNAIKMLPKLSFCDTQAGIIVYGVCFAVMAPRTWRADDRKPAQILAPQYYLCRNTDVSNCSPCHFFLKRLWCRELSVKCVTELQPVTVRNYRRDWLTLSANSRISGNTNIIFNEWLPITFYVLHYRDTATKPLCGRTMVWLLWEAWGIFLPEYGNFDDVGDQSRGG